MPNVLTRQRVRVAEIPIHDPARELRLALAFSFAYVFAALATGLVMRAWPQPIAGASYLTSDATYVGLFKVGLLLIVPTYAIRRAGYRVSDLLLGWHATPAAMIRVLALFVLGILVNGSKLSPIGAAAAPLPAGEAAARIMGGAVVVFFAAGLPEELVFRWGLQTRLERAWGRIAAMLVATLLFTAWHLPTRYLLASGAEGRAGDLASVLLGTGLPVFVVGLVFAWAWDRWRNLPALVALHWGIDVLPSVASFLKLPP